MKQTHIDFETVLDELTPRETSLTNKHAVPTRIVAENIGYKRRHTWELLNLSEKVEMVNVFDAEMNRPLEAWVLK